MYKWTLRLVPALTLLMTGCQTLDTQYLAKSELSEFTPLPSKDRTMNLVKMRWEVRQDVVEYCAGATGLGKERAYITPPVACAIWSVAAQTCTVVTGPVVTHVALGHEMRHCFEGHFHR